MAQKFIVTVPAQKDFDLAYWFYEDQLNGLGKEFARCIDAKMADLRRNPHLYKIIYNKNIRRALVSRFPFSVYFVEDPEAITVVATFITGRILRNGSRVFNPSL